MRSFPRPPRGALLLLSALLGDCAGAQPAFQAAPPRAPASSPRAPAPSPIGADASAQPASVGEPVPAFRESPGFAGALAALRPAATREALTALAAEPSDAERYARAALAYAKTEAPVMTLIWGLSYQAMGGGSENDALAHALADVLRERITLQPAAPGREATLSVKLAPGEAPTRSQPDGALQVPLAHAFEALFSQALTGFKPPWSVEQFYDALSIWAGAVATHGTPLDGQLTVDAWLVDTAKAGHLEAFCYALLGPAFPDELKRYRAQNADAIPSYGAYLQQAALHPSRAVMPDELVVLRPRTEDE